MDEDPDDDIPFGSEDDIPFGEPPDRLRCEPDFRVTYRRGRLQLINFFGTMADDGPAISFFAQRARSAVTIADLTRHQNEDGPEDLSVVYRARGRNHEAAQEAITDWAETVGFGRVWFPDYVVALEPRLGTANVARVKCPNCVQSWSAGGCSFWLTVWRAKRFPNICPLCGGDLPQWAVDDEGRNRGKDPSSWGDPTTRGKPRGETKARRGRKG